MNIKQMKTTKLRELLGGTTAESDLHEEITVELRRRSTGTPRRLRGDRLYARDARRAHRQARTGMSFKKWFRAQPKIEIMTEHLKKVHGGPHGKK